MLLGKCRDDVWCFGQSEVIRAILFEDSPCWVPDLGLRPDVELLEVRQRAVSEGELDALALDVLLADAGHHLRDVDVRALRAGHHLQQVEHVFAFSCGRDSRSGLQL